MGKTEFFAKDPTDRHVYERAQYFLQTDPDLQVIANDFTPEMFTVKGIEVLRTPLGTDDDSSLKCTRVTPNSSTPKSRLITVLPLAGQGDRGVCPMTPCTHLNQNETLK
jgi:hypothetical protein